MVYYPYFRGKQFDLLALKTLAQSEKLSENIQPVIEPVKNSATLQGTLKELTKKERSFYLIDNPQAGDFLTEDGLQQLAEITVPKAHIIDSLWEGAKDPQLLVADKAAAITRFSANLVSEVPVIVPLEFRILEKVSGPKILSEDPFTRVRNSFYPENRDESFTDSYRTFRRRGFVGFSDFTLDSRIYYDKSYPSRTLVLHLTYPTSTEVRIRHFTAAAEEIPFKEQYFQIMEQVLSEESRLFGEERTAGLQLLVDAYEAARFPGMGVMRKAAVMHHLEIIGRVLQAD